MKVNGLEIVVGKFYVVDMFSGPVGGPFETAEDAEIDRRQINIAEDCAVGIAENREGGKVGFRPAS